MQGTRAEGSVAQSAPPRESTIRPLFTWRSAVCESTLKPTTRHLLLTLSLHMNERGGSCFPSVDTLARETGLNRTTVMRQIDIAEGLGWLSIERSAGRTSHRYTATIGSNPPADTQDDRRPAQPSPCATVAQDHPNRRSHDAQPSLSRRPTVAQDDPSTSVTLQGTLQGTLHSGELALAAPRKRNVAFDALVVACGIDPGEVRGREARAIGTALAEIRSKWRGTDEELVAEIPRRAAAYLIVFSHATLTPNALANQWAKCTERGIAMADPRNRRALARAVADGPGDADRKARIIAKAEAARR